MPKEERKERLRRPCNLEGICDYLPTPKSGRQREAAENAKKMRVLGAWERIAPKDIAKRCDNIFLFREGDKARLVIYVESGMWAVELGTQKYRIARLMAEELKCQIDEVDIYPSSISHRRKEKEEEEADERVFERSIPASEEEIEQIASSLWEIENDRLKEALLRARIKDLEWKKGTKSLNSL